MLVATVWRVGGGRRRWRRRHGARAARACLPQSTAGGLAFAADGAAGVGFLCLAGRPIREPICWHGPFVMNTPAEIQQCFRDYQNGTFIKHKAVARTLSG